MLDSVLNIASMSMRGIIPFSIRTVWPPGGDLQQFTISHLGHDAWPFLPAVRLPDELSAGSTANELDVLLAKEEGMRIV